MRAILCLRQIQRSSKGSYQLKFNWTLTPSSAVLNEGDKFSIAYPVVAINKPFTAVNFAWSDFSDNSGVTIGRWRINNGKIDVELYASVSGRQRCRVNFQWNLCF